MAKNDDEIQTADYKTTASGKKVRAHRIVFNKGEDDQTKLRKEENELEERTLSGGEMNKREDIVKGMKKNYKGFVSKYGKDRAKSVMYATATKLAKEETEMTEQLKGNQHKLDKNKNGKLDKKDFELIRKEEVEMMDEAHPFDIPKSSGMSTSTKTKHDVKKTSTGTVYTKQRDSDGMAKEFKRDPDQAKRGRGRPKKNSFAEAAEFLMSLDEELFDSLMEDGFDAFVEHYEQLDELSKSTLSSYVKKAADDRADTGYHSGYWDRAHGGSKPEYKSQAEKEDGQEKRKAGIHKALHRLTK